MTGEQRLVAWYGSDPRRCDVAHVLLGPDRLRSRGTSCTADDALTYALQTGAGWVTRALEVRVDAVNGRRELELRRTGDGAWTARRRIDGVETPVRSLDVGDASDCDLALCPLTNTMPILRSGLLSDPTGTHEFRMAWVDVPSLDVHATVQTYGPATVDADGRTHVSFTSDGFEAVVVVDSDGVVMSYPSIGTAVPFPVRP